MTTESYGEQIFSDMSIGENEQYARLRVAHLDGQLMDELTCFYAAKYGHLNCLKYLRENGVDWDETEVCFAAICGGYIDCLKYARTSPYAEHNSLITMAAASGQIEVMQWLRDDGCPWNSDTCSTAAMRGRIESLQFAFEHGCPMTDYAARVAAEIGNLKCLKYAHEVGGVRLPAETSVKVDALDCLDYIRANTRNNM